MTLEETDLNSEENMKKKLETIQILENNQKNKLAQYCGIVKNIFSSSVEELSKLYSITRAAAAFLLLEEYTLEDLITFINDEETIDKLGNTLVSMMPDDVLEKITPDMPITEVKSVLAEYEGSDDVERS